MRPTDSSWCTPVDLSYLQPGETISHIRPVAQGTLVTTNCGAVHFIPSSGMPMLDKVQLTFHLAPGEHAVTFEAGGNYYTILTNQGRVLTERKVSTTNIGH